ncbi:hypothetical protein [Gimesia sp.]|uniref:hypothetical protein n=1 Tax=Gimesia sp. TaxID=2024833 RepID=UPI003A934B6E
MSSHTTQLKTSFLRITTAIVILCAIYLISYAIVGQSPRSQFNPTQKLFQILFAALQIGPLVLLWQWIYNHRLKPAVILWAAYTGFWLILILITWLLPLGPVYLLIMILFSMGVFLYASILLGAEIRSRRYDVTTLVATTVTLFSSGQLLVDFVLNPIVI